MEEFLTKMVGRKVDILCGAASSLRGEIARVEKGVLHLKDKDNRVCYVAIEKIIAIWEQLDDDHRAGFLPPLNTK
jgi:hypothetical protein